jgi:16S rRNA (guanine966-N2)-methyltransferase
LVLPRGDAVRPATDALRQAVFSSLALRVPGARFLDLFAGSGAYGLEAFSRGASGGTFIERDSQATAFIRRNIAAVAKSMRRDSGALQVVTADATSAPWGDPPDLVFIDPPYAAIAGLVPKLFARLGQLLAGSTDPVVVFEAPGEMELAPDGWHCIKRLGKGARQPTACIFRKAPVAP